uniref:Ig-like domain-containing protein n=1 Tax=Anopheles maculatus TaxID=74869 RepID=A0A182T5Y5_9DIPT
MEYSLSLFLSLCFPAIPTVPPFHLGRQALPNGTLYFPPFAGHLFRTDVHDTTYRCRISYSYYVLLSHDIRVRAVVRQPYEVKVENGDVTLANTAFLKCFVSSHVREFVHVSSWFSEKEMLLPGRSDIGTRYVITTPGGELCIRNVNEEDRLKRFSCVTVDTLTGERKTSEAILLALKGTRYVITTPGGELCIRNVNEEDRLKRFSCVTVDTLTGERKTSEAILLALKGTFALSPEIPELHIVRCSSMRCECPSIESSNTITPSLYLNRPLFILSSHNPKTPIRTHADSTPNMAPSTSQKSVSELTTGKGTSVQLPCNVQGNPVPSFS